MEMFNPDRMKVIRKELFPSPRDPSVTIRDGNISFNAACIRKLEGVVWVKLMFDEETGLFSVSGCDQNDKKNNLLFSDLHAVFPFQTASFLFCVGGRIW